MRMKFKNCGPSAESAKFWSKISTFTVVILRAIRDTGLFMIYIGNLYRDKVPACYQEYLKILLMLYYKKL